MNEIFIYVPFSSQSSSRVLFDTISPDTHTQHFMLPFLYFSLSLWERGHCCRNTKDEEKMPLLLEFPRWQRVIYNIYVETFSVAFRQ